MCLSEPHHCSHQYVLSIFLYCCYTIVDCFFLKVCIVICLRTSPFFTCFLFCFIREYLKVCCTIFDVHFHLFDDVFYQLIRQFLPFIKTKFTIQKSLIFIKEFFTIMYCSKFVFCHITEVLIEGFFIDVCKSFVSNLLMNCVIPKEYTISCCSEFISTPKTN